MGKKGEKRAIEDFRNNPKCIFVAKCAFMYFSQMIQKTQYRFDTQGSFGSVKTHFQIKILIT